MEIYPEGELGGEREMLEQVLLGELTMIAPASAPLDAVSKYMAVWDLPYLFNDRDTAHKVSGWRNWPRGFGFSFR